MTAAKRTRKATVRKPRQTAGELLHELSQPPPRRPTNTGGELRRQFREEKGTRPANASERRNRFKRFAEFGLPAQGDA